MSKNKRTWFTRFLARRTKQGKPVAPKTRRLGVEILEPRQMLSGSPTVAQLLAAATPDPHPTGDQPANPAAMVTLSNYDEGMILAPTGITEVDDYFSGLQTIYDGIADNPAERPSYWGENVATGTHEYRIHLDDNGMLTDYWTIDWGDGSTPQSVPLQPWVVHQYATGGQYTISVTADSTDGSYSASTTGIVDVESVGIGGSGDGGLSVTEPELSPTLHVAGAQTIAAGQTFALDNLASFTSTDACTDALAGVTSDYSYSIDWGDGSQPFNGNNVEVIAAGNTNGALFVGALSRASGDGSLTHAYSDPGTYDVNVTVTNNTSELSDTQTIPVTVVQLVPTINGLPTNNTCDEGDPVSLTATVAPTPTDPIAYAWQVTDSEGDMIVQSSDPTLSYTFTSPDTYTVSLVTTVDGVASAPAVATINVANVASFVGTIANGSVSLGQTFNLSAAFTDVNPNDTHTFAVDWGDGSPLDTGAAVNEETTDGTTMTPGTVNDSYVYATAGTYTVKATLTDAEGLSTTESFTVDVVAADVTLNSFTASSGGSQLDVSYTISGATAAAFSIGIYSSPDGSTPDQLLTSLNIDGSGSYPLAPGTYTAAFTPQFDDIQSNYHLIAVSDANSDSTENTVEFAGGIFVAQSLTASPPQNILYVFGSNSGDLPGSGGDTVAIHGAADSPANTVVFDGGTPFTIASDITGIHVRGEAGNDDFEADPDVTLPLWLYGGAGDSTLVGGEGNNLVAGGSGANTIHSSNGLNQPQTVDDSDTTSGGLVNYFHDTGTWTSQSAAGAFNGEQLSHVASSGSDTAVWTFDDLNPTGYYDVYVTWTPVAGASTAAQYSVLDDDGTLGTPPTVDQTQAPADMLVDGTYWHQLGVYQPSTTTGLGTLYIHLASDTTGEALADAAMIVPHQTPPLTNLTMDSFSIDNSGDATVSYTVSEEDSPPFSIGIYGSSDGRQPTDLLQTYQVDDPTLLTGGGASHTVSFTAELGSLSNGEYVIAMLDAYDQVFETDKTDNSSSTSASTALGGVFQSDDGSVQVLGSSTGGQTITVAQTDADGISVTVDGGTPVDYENVSQVIINAYQGANTIDASSVTEPLVIDGGTGGDTITGGAGDTTIYGGLGANTIYAGAGDTTIYGQGVNNQIFGGAGTDTIYAGNSGDTIAGGSGNDYIYGGAGPDVITGGSGDNWIDGGSGNETIYGGPTYDYIQCGSGTDLVNAGSGTEFVYCGSGTDTVIGGPGYDNLYGGSGTDTLIGRGLHDVLVGGSGHTTIVSADQAAYDATSGADADSFTASQLSTHDVLNFHSYDGLVLGPYSDSNAVEGDYGAETTPGLAWAPSFLLSSGDRLESSSGTEVAVYINYDNLAPLPSLGDTHWTADAYYVLYDGTTEIGEEQINQSEPCNTDSPVPNDIPWQRLVIDGQNTFDITSGHLTVEFCYGDPNNGYAVTDDSPMYIDAVMVEPLWPGAKIVSDVSQDGQINSIDQAAKQSQPLTITQGATTRTEVDLSVSIESAFASTGDWQAELFVPTGSSLIQVYTAATGGTLLTPVPGGYIDSWPLVSGQASVTVWVQAAAGGDTGTGTLLLQAVNVDAPHEVAQDAVNFVTKQQETIVIFLDSPSNVSRGTQYPAILTQTDWQSIETSRTSYVASLGVPTLLASDDEGTNLAYLQSAISAAQRAENQEIWQQLAVVQKLELVPPVNEQAYAAAYLALAKAYDGYLRALQSVALARVVLINSLNAPAPSLHFFDWSDPTVQAALNASYALPLTFDELQSRGISPLPSELFALQKLAGLASQSLQAAKDKLDYAYGFVSGARNAIVVGGIAIGVAALLGPAAIGPGLALLAAGAKYDFQLRSQQGVSGVALATSVATDLTGLTSLKIGLTGEDPYTGQKYNAEQSGASFGAGLVTVGLTLAGSAVGSQNGVSTTLELPNPKNWVTAARYVSMRVIGGGTMTVPVPAYAPIAVPFPTSLVATTATTLGGGNIVLMAGKPGGGSANGPGIKIVDRNSTNLQGGPHNGEYTIYHVADSEASAESIVNDGIQPVGVDDGNFYVSPNPARAVQFGDGPLVQISIPQELFDQLWIDHLIKQSPAHADSFYITPQGQAAINAALGL